MNIVIFLLLNIFSYFILLSLLNHFFKNKFIYPFRLFDLINFVINLIIFCYFAYFNFDLNILISTFIINLNLLYIFFHIQNMINTSPRTKILLDLFINQENFEKYNEKIVVNNRIKRLNSSKQIILKNKFIEINKNKKSFFIVNFVFNIIKKI